MGEVIDKIVEHVLDTDYRKLPEDSLEWAKVRVLDVFGCMIAGYKASGSLAIKGFVEEIGGKAESSLLWSNKKVPSYLSAFVHAVWARSFDYEPVHPYVHHEGYPAHITGTTVPVALAVAEATLASPQDMLASLVIGDDITSRIVAASQFTLELGWDNTGTTNIFGACAIAGRLLGLSKEELANAFGLVVNQSGGILQNVYDAVDAFKLPQGLAAFAGIISAKLAKKGFSGVKDPFEGRYGFFRLYCQEYNPEIVLKDLGKHFFSDGVIKPYPCCRANHAAVDCAIAIAKKVGVLAPDAVKSIDLYVDPRLIRIFVNRPYSSGRVKQIDAAFNIRFCVAKALLKGNLKIWHFEGSELEEEGVVRLCNLIRILPIEDEKAGACRIEICLKDGESLCAEEHIAKGDRFHNPLTFDEIKLKFFENIHFAGIEEGRAQKLFEVVRSIEEFSKVKDWMQELKLVLASK